MTINGFHIHVDADVHCIMDFCKYQSREMQKDMTVYENTHTYIYIKFQVKGGYIAYDFTAIYLSCIHDTTTCHN